MLEQLGGLLHDRALLGGRHLLFRIGLREHRGCLGLRRSRLGFLLGGSLFLCADGAEAEQRPLLNLLAGLLLCLLGEAAVVLGLLALGRLDQPRDEQSRFLVELDELDAHPGRLVLGVSWLVSFPHDPTDACQYRLIIGDTDLELEQRARWER